MAYYNICPDCGAHLDPGEPCDCQDEKAKRQEFYAQSLKMEPKARQLAFVFGSMEGNSESKNY